MIAVFLSIVFEGSLVLKSQKERIGVRKEMIQVVRPVSRFGLCWEGRQLIGRSVVYATTSSLIISAVLMIVATLSPEMD